MDLPAAGPAALNSRPVIEGRSRVIVCATELGIPRDLDVAIAELDEDEVKS
jgi:hypothetical protein